MTEEIQKNRSPNYPKVDIGQAVELVRKLAEKIGRSAVKAEIAVQALGYNGMNGAALGTLGAISQYGLVDRESGNVQVTALALKILHPVDDGQKTSALKLAALTPKVFSDIQENWSDMSEDVLSNHLIQQGFTPDGAKRAAAVFKANSALAKLGVASSLVSTEEKPKPSELSTQSEPKPLQTPAAPQEALKTTPRTSVLATFKIPIGLAEAELIFTGEKLVPEDFDALADYVELFKKQYQRKQSAAALIPPTGSSVSQVAEKLSGIDLTTVNSTI